MGEKITAWKNVNDELPDFDEYVLWKFEDGYIIFECLDKDADIDTFLHRFGCNSIVAWTHVPE